MMNLTALAFYKNPPPKREPPPTPSFPLPHSVIPANAGILTSIPQPNLLPPSNTPLPPSPH